MGDSNQKNNWMTEAVKQIPLPAVFLFVCLYSFYLRIEPLGWFCLAVAVFTASLLIKFEYYEKIMSRQENQIEQFSKNALAANKNATETACDIRSFYPSKSSLYEKIDDYTNNQ